VAGVRFPGHNIINGIMFEAKSHSEKVRNFEFTYGRFKVDRICIERCTLPELNTRATITAIRLGIYATRH
jgi:hypothetical protein